MTRTAPPLPLLASVLLCLLLLQASTHAYLFINYQQQQQQTAAANLGLLPNGFNLASPISSNNLNLAGQQQQQSSQQSQDRQHHQAANQLFQQDSSNNNNNNNNNNQDNTQYSPQQPPQATSNSNQFAPTGNQQQQQQLNQGNLNNGQQQQAAASYQAPIGSARNSQQPPSGITDRDVSPIFRFHGTALNSTTVKLVWSLMSGYQADLFEIKYGPIPDTEVFSVTLNGSARDYTISSLQPDAPYQFRLQAYQGDGRSWKPQLYMMEPLKSHMHQFSSSTRQQGGLVEQREITPLGVKAEAKSNQTIQLSWTEQERPKELLSAKRMNFIRYYVVSSQSAAGSNNETTAGPGAPGGSTATATNSSIKYHYLNVSETQIRESRVIIHKLKPATEYAFAVRTAYYPLDAGRPPVLSGFSMDTLVKTFDLEPSAPRNFSLQPMQLTREETQQGQTIPKLELTWSPPESPNGQLKGYVILYAHEPNPPDDKWSRIQVNDSTINNWYVANLRPGASYYFKMRAINQRGQSQDTETRLFIAPPPPTPPLAGPVPPSTVTQPHQTIGRMDAPIPANNILMLIVICLIAILFILFLVVSRLFCRTRSGAGGRKSGQRKAAAAMRSSATDQQQQQAMSGGDSSSKLNGFGSSTVTGRMGTLARRTQRQVNGLESQGGGGKQPDFWISAMDQQQHQAAVAAAAAAAASSDIKSNLSEKSNTSDNINMAAMVSIQRDSPQQFTTQTTQLAPIVPEYRLAAEQQLLQQIQHQGHYHPGHQHHQHQFSGALGYDQMDNATASALMTLSKRQQQQLQKYQIQFASTGAGGNGAGGGGTLMQAPSPHQQPPPPPPLNIEQQHLQHHHQQALYGTHQALNSTRSLRLHRPTLYDPVSGSFVQPTPSQQQQQQHQQHQQDPPNYNSHLNSMLNGVHHQLQSFNNNNNNTVTTSGSNTLQFHHPHQTSTLMSRRSTNTLRSFQSSAGPGLYGQLGANSFAVPPSLSSSMAGNNGTTANSNDAGNQPQLLQSHQAVINQLNDSSTYPSLPLKHVSAVRPQMMSSLDDQIEMELAEKQAEQQHQQHQQNQHQQNQQHQQQQDQHS